uniref:Uncharacterized protein n=1 Tax=viral metagenome TaxID=1070528 RepID=A0A6C0C1E8_9ZZZZ
MIHFVTKWLNDDLHVSGEETSSKSKQAFVNFIMKSPSNSCFRIRLERMPASEIENSAKHSIEFSTTAPECVIVDRTVLRRPSHGMNSLPDFVQITICRDSDRLFNYEVTSVRGENTIPLAGYDNCAPTADVQYTAQHSP